MILPKSYAFDFLLYGKRNEKPFPVLAVAEADCGDDPEIRPGEVPVFRACGVTAQMALQRAKPDFVITRAPGYTFITDILNKDLCQS